MQFLDAIGLASFWKKIKNWVNINYLSLTGGTIRGSVSFLNEADSGKSIRIDPSNITNSNYGVNYLFASGKMIPIGAANGVAGLDSKGNIPLAQLGNLDTTVAEVVTALPTTNIKKHIYLIKDASGVSQNQYEEYIYTGDTSATYDASKWEKLGDFRATVDLADYAKKNKAANELNITPHESQVNFTLLDIDGGEISDTVLGQATSTQAGVMIPSDKKKLDGIANNANNYSLPTASSTIKGGITLGYSQNGKNYPVVLDTNGKAYVNVPWIDTNTTYDLSPYAKKTETVNNLKVETQDAGAGSKRQFIGIYNADNKDNLAAEISILEATTNMSGFISYSDKGKLDSIDYGATEDSAIPISVIDALN